MTTVYTPALSNPYDSLSYRTRMDYTTSTSNDAVSVTVSFTLQYKGTYKVAEGGLIPGGSAWVQINGTKYEIAKKKPTASKSDWTNLESKAIPAQSFPRGTTEKTSTIYCNVSSSMATQSEPVVLTIPALPSYNVTYNANGGTGAPSTQKKYYGQSLKLSSIKPTRANYVFRQWNTKSDNSGTPYAPGATYSANAALALYAIWYPPYTVSYNANGGSGAPGNQTKVYDKDLKLSTTKPTRTNATFVSWNTKADGSGTSYDPGDTYSANAALTLYAIWVPKPQITTLTAVRCDAEGNDDDEGNYARVRAVWSLDTTISPSVSSGTLTGTVTPQSGGGATAITLSGATSGSGGTATAIVPNLDTDMQYTITVTATAGTQTTQKSVILTRAFFIMDFKAGGGAIGIGRAAPATGLEVGYAATFDAGLKSLGAIFTYDRNFVVHDDDIEMNVMPSDANVTTQGLFVEDTNAKWLSRVVARNYTSGLQGTLVETHRVVNNTDVYNTLNIGVRADGTLYVSVSDKGAWRDGIGAVDKTGDTVSGTLVLSKRQDAAYDANNSPALIVGGTAAQSHIEIDDNEIIAKAGAATPAPLYLNGEANGGKVYANNHEVMTVAGGSFTGAVIHEGASVYLDDGAIDRDGAVPSSNQIGQQIVFRDKNNERIGFVRVDRDTDGYMKLKLGVFVDDTTPAEIYNMLTVQLHRNGTKKYSVTSPAAFRDAIGVGTIGTKDSLAASDIPALAASKITSGTFSADRIPSLAASKIGSGTLDVARLPTLFAVGYVDITVSSIAHGGNSTATGTAPAKTGYTAHSIRGYNYTGTTRQNWVNLWACYVDSSTRVVTLKLCNLHASDAANVTVRVYVLYINSGVL